MSKASPAAIGGTIGGGGLGSTTGFTPQRGLLTDSSGTVVTNDRFQVIADETSVDVYATNFFGNLRGNLNIPGLRVGGVVHVGGTGTFRTAANVSVSNDGFLETSKLRLTNTGSLKGLLFAQASGNVEVTNVLSNISVVETDKLILSGKSGLKGLLYSKYSGDVDLISNIVVDDDGHIEEIQTDRIVIGGTSSLRNFLFSNNHSVESTNIVYTDEGDIYTTGNVTASSIFLSDIEPTSSLTLQDVVDMSSSLSGPINFLGGAKFDTDDGLYVNSLRDANEVTVSSSLVTTDKSTGEILATNVNIRNDTIEAAVYANFLGAHAPGYVDNLESISSGHLLSATGVVAGTGMTGVSPGVQISSGAQDSTVIGIARVTPSGFIDILTSGFTRVRVNNSNGSISLGDYICSSSTPGEGMKESTDHTTKFTIAKTLESMNEQSGIIACVIAR